MEINKTSITPDKINPHEVVKSNVPGVVHEVPNQNKTPELTKEEKEKQVEALGKGKLIDVKV